MGNINKIKPLFDRILLKPEAEQQTDGGIIIPKSGDDRSLIMRVEDAGSSQFLKCGDRVVVAKYAGTEVTVGDRKFLLVCEYDILGVAE